MSTHADLRKLAANDTTPSTQAATRIYLARGKFDRRFGQRYNARLGSTDGEQIITDALDVEFTACRALKARGATGPMEIWRLGAATPHMLIADLAKAATWTIREDERRGPTLVKYRPWTSPDVKRRASVERTHVFQHADCAQIA